MQYRAVRPLTRGDVVWFVGVACAMTIAGGFLIDSDSLLGRAGIGFGVGVAVIVSSLVRRRVQILRNRRSNQGLHQ